MKFEICTPKRTYASKKRAHTLHRLKLERASNRFDLVEMNNSDQAENCFFLAAISTWMWQREAYETEMWEYLFLAAEQGEI